MKKLLLVRHGLSQWNEENRFTGWTDVPLSDEGIAEAAKAARSLRDHHPVASKRLRWRYLPVVATRPSRKRSITKALTYRVVIICLDFAVIYLLTGKATIAAGFMVVSNVYTTVGYILHERIWARTTWGMETVPSVVHHS